MSLTYDDWETELEDAIVTHIDIYVATDVDIVIERQVERPFTKPVITIAQIDGDSENTGGMNTVGDGEQGRWEKPSYYITVMTDNGDYDDNGRIGRNKVAAQLQKVAFDKYLHIFKTATEATWVNMRQLGVITGGGPTADNQTYQRVFMLDIKVIIPYTSVVI